MAASNDKPFPAEISRTIMELSSVATLSTLTHDGWPHGTGVRFAVDSDGTPVLCLNGHFSADRRSSLHVQVKIYLKQEAFSCSAAVNCMSI